MVKKLLKKILYHPLQKSRLKRIFSMTFLQANSMSFRFPSTSQKFNLVIFCQMPCKINLKIESSLSKHLPTFLPQKTYVPEYTIYAPFYQETLLFLSKFESGNLKKAIRVSKNEYELILSSDFNTNGHFHWFNFKTVSTLPAGTRVTFKILNMTKPNSLYTVGFKPFSKHTRSNEDWSNSYCLNVRYYKTPAEICKKPFPYVDQHSQKQRFDYLSEDIKKDPNELTQFYTLEWEYVYEKQGDEISFSQFPPYTLSDLISDLKDYKSRTNDQNILNVNTLCRTLAKNPCPVLTITSNIDSYLPFDYERVLSLKSLAARRLIHAKVEKIRSQLLRQQSALKYKKGRKKTKTKEDLNSIENDENSAHQVSSIEHTQKLSDLSDPGFIKEHPLECIFINFV